MLTENETNRVWEKMLHAQIRALYFADLASRDTRRKQVITGLSFFLSSGAAAALVAKLPEAWPLSMSVVSAAAAAYSIAVALDKRAGVCSKLHYTWSSLSQEYEWLWNHWFEEDSQQRLMELSKRGRDASETAVTEAPNNEKMMNRWTDLVYAQYGDKNP